MCQYLCTIWLNFWSQSKIQKILERVKYMLPEKDGWLDCFVGSETHYTWWLLGQQRQNYEGFYDITVSEALKNCGQHGHFHTVLDDPKLGY